MAWVGQTDEGQFVFLPIAGKSAGIFGTEYQNLGILFYEFIVILAQLRHMPLAERSEETAIENQQHILFVLKI